MVITQWILVNNFKILYLGGVRMADYAASKFATIGFEESLRMELRAEGFDGIHSTVVCPWFVKTGMFAGARSEIIPYLEPQFVASSIMSGIFNFLNNELLS